MVHARQLIDRAQTGEKLSTSERRYAIEFLMATEPDKVVNTQLAELFSVTERTIRVDRQTIREAKAKYLKDELSRDAGLFIADIAMEFEHQVRDIEKSKQKAPPGSRRFLDHCVAIMDLRLRMTKAFQEIGYLPKNLGNMTVDKYVYKAVVHKDGSVDVRQTSEFTDAEVQDAEVVPLKALPPLDAENESTRELPAASAEFAEFDDAGEGSNPSTPASAPASV